MELKFRTLKAKEIDVRVGTASANEQEDKYGCSLLLYKDARVDMTLLDEVCKPYGWCREHKELKGVIYCGVGIKEPETGEWVYKWDAGAESFSDKEKGEASDSFKRACVNWGIGRELYTADFIWVKLVKADFYFDNREKKWKLNKDVKFNVKEIEYDDNRQISKLVITDQRGAVCYTYPKQKYVAQSAPKSVEKVTAPPKAETPAEHQKNDVPDVLEILCDIGSADTIDALRVNVAMAVGQAFEDEVRYEAAKRGVEIGKTSQEVHDAYELIKGRPNADKIQEKAMAKARDNKWIQ